MLESSNRFGHVAPRAGSGVELDDGGSIVDAVSHEQLERFLEHVNAGPARDAPQPLTEKLGDEDSLSGHVTQQDVLGADLSGRMSDEFFRKACTDASFVCKLRYRYFCGSSGPIL